MFNEIEVTTHFSTTNLKQDYTKTEDIRRNREYSFHCIFWSHVPTFWILTSLLLLLLLFKKPRRREIKEEVAYYVPAILLVLTIFWFLEKILAIPKSDILATMLWSNNTWLDFKSL